MQEIYKEIRAFLADTNDVESMFESDAIIWVDWREDDEDVVKYVNEVLPDDDKFDYKTEIDEDGGFSIILFTKGLGLINGKSITISNPNSRDITIKGINDFINPKHEMRWFMESLGDDTLGFVVLSNDEWKMLEEEFGKDKVHFFFEPISQDKKMFDLTMNEISDLMDKRKENKF